MRIRALPLGVYLSGTSWLHRLSPATKLLTLFVFIIGLTILPTRPLHSVIALALIVALYCSCRVPPRIILQQSVPLIPLLLFMGLFLWWQNGGERALTTIIGLVASILAANLLTLTTTIDALLHTLEKGLQPFERFGVPTSSISLTIALTLRLVPLMLHTAYEVIDARKARGLGFSPVAFGIPFLIRSMRQARNIGDALLARGALDSD